MDIQTLRKMRNSNFSKISQAFENPEGEKKSYKDDRYWKPTVDKAGNARATIRFLPTREGDELPWVKLYTHGFQGPTGKWYIENSLTTLGENDPVSELNSQLWNSTTDEKSPSRKQAREQKRKLSYISNILVIDDPANPDNNGKVFLFRYGKKIFDKIMTKAKPTFDDEEPVVVFDFWEGANFKLRQRKGDGGWPNYDDSIFESISAIAESDEDILAIANSQHSLSDIVDRKNFKTYEELARKLASVLGTEGTGESTKTAAQISEEEEEEYTPPTRQVAKSTVTKQAAKPAPKAPVMDEEDEDDAMDYFRRIAQED